MRKKCVQAFVLAILFTFGAHTVRSQAPAIPKPAHLSASPAPAANPVVVSGGGRSFVRAPGADRKRHPEER